MRGFTIPDQGYTEEAYVGSRAGFHESIEFTFCPMLPEEQYEFLASIGKFSGRTKALLIAKAVAPRIKSWSIPETAISPASFARLNPELFDRLYGIIIGTYPTDLNPKWDTSKKSEEVDADELASISAMPVGAAKLETRTKN